MDAALALTPELSAAVDPALRPRAAWPWAADSAAAPAGDTLPFGEVLLAVAGAGPPQGGEPLPPTGNLLPPDALAAAFAAPASLLPSSTDAVVRPHPDVLEAPRAAVQSRPLPLPLDGERGGLKTPLVLRGTSLPAADDGTVASTSFAGAPRPSADSVASLSSLAVAAGSAPAARGEAAAALPVASAVPSSASPATLAATPAEQPAPPLPATAAGEQGVADLVRRLTVRNTREAGAEVGTRGISTEAARMADAFAARAAQPQIAAAATPVPPAQEPALARLLRTSAAAVSGNVAMVGDAATGIAAAAGASGTAAASGPATTAFAAPAGETHATHGQPLDTTAEAWNDALAGRIRWLVDHGIGEARVKLHPAELGALDIKISLRDDQTFVQLGTSTAAARVELEQSLPRLRELFAQSGLTLGGATVDGGRGEHAPRTFGGESPQRFLAAAEPLAVEGHATGVRAARGQIDLYA